MSGIHHLAHGDPFARPFEIGTFAEDHGRLAAEFEGDRDEVLRRGLHHLAPRLGRTGEDQMVEGQCGKFLRHLRPAGDEGDFLRREILRREFAREFARLLREFTGLDHGAVAGSEHLHQRTERQVYREIPRAEDADDALGLVAHFRLRAQQRERKLHLALVGLGPVVEVLEAVFAEADRPGNVGHHGLPRTAIAEIGAHRLAQRIAILFQKSDSALDTVLALGKLFGPRSGKILALPV